MKRLSAILIVLVADSTALGWPSFSPPAAQTPHPAVVRVTSIDHDGASLGSGVLVAVNQTHGLVITNFHVVRDTTGQILVSFPDGFTSGAVVLKTDSTWDLAALAIWRPNAQPARLATAPPRPGEVLTIAGYGRDSYRAVSGYCKGYLSPAENTPNELVEVEDAAARQGDSGGPIFNARGEVAGVLFGSNDSVFTGQYTLGSYCGRVCRFVAAAGGDFQRLPVNPAMVARQGPAVAGPAPVAAIAAASPRRPPPSLCRQRRRRSFARPSRRPGKRPSPWRNRRPWPPCRRAPARAIRSRRFWRPSASLPCSSTASACWVQRSGKAVQARAM